MSSISNPTTSLHILVNQVANVKHLKEKLSIANVKHYNDQREHLVMVHRGLQTLNDGYEL